MSLPIVSSLFVHRQATVVHVDLGLEQPGRPLTDFEVTRTLTGATQAQGLLRVTLRNLRDHDIELLYVETMPWFVTFYLHTLALTINGVRRGMLFNYPIDNMVTEFDNQDELMTKMVYTPPEAHGRPTLFEARLILPAYAVLDLSMDVVKGFLRYTEHPPDAQRGWDLPPAVLVPLSVNASLSKATGVQRVYSSTLLIDVATPDFSMPYNVIIMSSTLIALIFGSIFNLFTRSFVITRVDDVDKKKDAPESAGPTATVDKKAE